MSAADSHHGFEEAIADSLAPEDYVEDDAHWSCEAEQALLGAVLLSPNAMLDIGGRALAPSHFYDSRHAEIWSAMLSMTARGVPIDVVTTFEHLQSSGRAEHAGGLAALHAVAQYVPSPANLARYAEIVVDKAMRRAIAGAVDEVKGIVSKPGHESGQAVLDRIASVFGAIERTQAAGAPQRMSDLLAARLEHWQMLEGGETASGISTGFPRLDSALGGGLKAGKVIVVAARTSVGKTSLAQQIGLNAAGAQQPVLMLSQEMPAGDLVDRAVANLGNVELDHLTTGKFQEGDWTRVTAAADAASMLPFFVDDQAALTLLDIRAKARHVQQKHGLAVLIVDYLQLCASAGASDRRHHQIEQISRGMKQLAKELGLCVVVLSQISRKATERDEPELHDLKESGAIEEDADVVILLHPFALERDGSTVILAKVPKNRQGRRGRFALTLHGKTQHWEESDANVARRNGATT